MNPSYSLYRLTIRSGRATMLLSLNFDQEFPAGIGHLFVSG
ncbi:hypothetical protein [Arthrobacter parietis]